jgi:hypothetical protein
VDHDLTLVGYEKDPEGSEFWIGGGGNIEGYLATTIGFEWSRYFACLLYHLV